MSTELVKHSALSGASLPEMISYAEELANANLLPGQYRKQPANVLFAMEYGRTLGITPIAAITGIHVIEGKPSASAALIGGLVRQAGHKLRVTGNAQSATAQIVRSDDPDFTYEVTWELRKNPRGNPNAEDARLLNKDVWQKYPASMLKSRAIAQVARDACEEVLFGLHYTPEELDMNVGADGAPVSAEVTHLRRVQPNEQDPWAGPAQQATPEAFTPHPAGQEHADSAAESDKGKDHIGARWKQAAQAQLLGAEILAPDTKQPDKLGAYLTRLGSVLPDVAPVEESAGETVVDVEIVDEVAAAEQQLRAAAAKAGLDNLDEEFQRSYGIAIADAGLQQLTEMTQILGGVAA